MALVTRLMDPFQARRTFEHSGQKVGYYRLARLEEMGLTKIATLPYSIRILLESALRNCEGSVVTEQDVKNQKPTCHPIDRSKTNYSRMLRLFRCRVNGVTTQRAVGPNPFPGRGATRKL